MESEVLFVGEHLEFRRRRGWEYVEHRTAKESVMVDPKVWAGVSLAGARP